jgi:peptidoglycan hydrolase-like protein with peptidoglycan-binding domain
MVSALKVGVLGFYLAVSFFLALSLVSVRADDQVRSTQEELRRRNIYFGEIDGAQSPELSEAIKHYQMRKGFAANGQTDQETLRSLGLVPRQPGEAPPKELAWPSEPVLKSDANINVPAEAQQIAQETGVPASIVASDVVPARTRFSRHHPGQTSSLAATTAMRGPAAENRGPIRHAEPPEIGEFVTDYLKAASRNDLRDEIHFYADRLAYFHNGNLDRRIVERVLRDYEQQWSKRRYALAGPVEYQKLPSKGQILVEFRVNFVLKNHHSAVKGQTENRVVIDAATADPRIVSIQEQRVRS